VHVLPRRVTHGNRRQKLPRPWASANPFDQSFFDRRSRALCNRSTSDSAVLEGAVSGRITFERSESALSAGSGASSKVCTASAPPVNNPSKHDRASRRSSKPRAIASESSVDRGRRTPSVRQSSSRGSNAATLAAPPTDAPVPRRIRFSRWMQSSEQFATEFAAANARYAAEMVDVPRRNASPHTVRKMVVQTVTWDWKAAHWWLEKRDPDEWGSEQDCRRCL
jgi:hypothetical protein